jgi:flagellar motor switch protein FliM
MSRKSSAKATAPVSLVRATHQAPVFPGLDRAGRKLARGLADVFSRLLSSEATVSVSSVKIVEHPAVDGTELRNIRLSSRATVAIAVERQAIVRLVDIFYGGDGTVAGQPTKLSIAEDRFLTRIAAALCELLPAALGPLGLVTAELDDEHPLTASAEAAVQTFTISWADRPPFSMECRFPRTMIDAVPALAAEATSSTPANEPKDWQARLTHSALGVGFPVRAVFAEPVLPLATLMRLQAGDIIPVSAPSEIGLMLCGRRLAGGQAGESNGRAAISIDRI